MRPSAHAARSRRKCRRLSADGPACSRYTTSRVCLYTWLTTAVSGNVTSPAPLVFRRMMSVVASETTASFRSYHNILQAFLVTTKQHPCRKREASLVRLRFFLPSGFALPAVSCLALPPLLLGWRCTELIATTSVSVAQLLIASSSTGIQEQQHDLG